MAGLLGFYEDAAKVTPIVTSDDFTSRGRRNEYSRSGDYRLNDGTLETWSEENYKYEEIITLNGVSITDRNTLKTWYDSQTDFYYYPDVDNLATEYYNVMWAGKYVETYNKQIHLYTITISVKEI